MPDPLKVARVLMYVVAAITALLVVAIFMIEGITARAIGTAIWFAWPGVVSAILARRMAGGGIWLRRGILALQIYSILLALAAVANADPRGLVNLILPVAIVTLVTRRTAGRYFRSPREDRQDPRG